MNKAAALQRRFGDNIEQSIGKRSAPPPQNDDPKDVIPMATPDAGRSRYREAGHMEIDKIIPDPDQVRKDFSTDSLERLGESLKRFGQLQPIRVRWNQDEGKWIILTGERRYRAAKLVGLAAMTCIFVQDDKDKSQTLQEQLTENCLREDLKPIDQANAYKSLIDLNGWNAAQLAEALCVSKGAVSKSLSLLKLPEDVQQKVAHGSLSGSAAYQVAKLKDEDAQREMATKIETEGLNRDAAAEEVTKKTKPEKTKARPGRPVTVKTFKLESCKVTMTFNRKRVTQKQLLEAYEELGKQINAA